MLFALPTGPCRRMMRFSGPSRCAPAREHLDELAERHVQTEDGVASAVERVVEEPPSPGPAAPRRLLEAVRLDHVEQALPGVACDQRVLSGQGQVVLEAALPVEGGVALCVEPVPDDIDE